MENATQQLERGRFEGEVLARLDNLGQKLDKLFDGQSDHEDRLRGLEDDRARTKGVTLAIGAAAGGLIQVVSIAAQWFASK